MDAYVGKPVEADQLFTTIEGLAALVVSAEEPEEEDQALFDRAELLERVDDDMELLRHLFELFTRDYPGLLARTVGGGDAAYSDACNAPTSRSRRGSSASCTSPLSVPTEPGGAIRSSHARSSFDAARGSPARQACSNRRKAVAADRSRRALRACQAARSRGRNLR